MRESAVEQVLTSAAKGARGLALKWVSPGNAGIPDRLVVLPMPRCECCGAQARIGAIELKRPGEVLRPLQVRQAQRLQALGMPVGWADTPGAALAWLQGLQKGAIQ